MICPRCHFAPGEPTKRCEGCGRPLDEVEPRTSPPLVGRTRELALLDAALDAVRKTRAAHWIGLSGSGGSGRSRLLGAFARRHDNAFSEVTTLRGFLTPSGRVGDPFEPFGRLLHRALQLDESEGPDARREQMERALEALKPPALDDAIRGAAEVLGLGPARMTGPLPSLTADCGSASARAVFSWVMRRLASRQPLVLLVESLRGGGADAVSLARWLRDGLADAPVLVVAEIDPTDAGRWSGLFDEIVHLEPLDGKQVGALLAERVGRMEGPPEAVIEKVMEVTGGHPGDVVLVAESLARGDASGANAGWDVELAEQAIADLPLTSARSIERRLATLDPQARDWLVRAAIVGAVFWQGALRVVARAQGGAAVALVEFPQLPPDAEIMSALQESTAAGIIHPMADSTVAGEREYAFTRPQEREALVETTPPAHRAPLHRAVAQWLELRTARRPGGHLHRIAEHYRQAGERRLAASFYTRAGARAREQRAHQVANEAYERALELLDAADAIALVEVTHGLGVLHALAGRAERAERAFERMLGAAWALDHRGKAGAALNRLGRLRRDRGEYDEARRLLIEGQSLFAEAGDAVGVAASNDDLGQVALLMGDTLDAQHRFEEALAARRAARDDRAVALSLTNLARLWSRVGEEARAAAALREALTLRERVGDISGLTESRLALAELLLVQGELEPAVVEVGLARSSAREAGDRRGEARADALEAALRVEMGDRNSANELASRAAALAEQIGDRPTQARAMRSLARSRQPEDDEGALEVARAALSLAERCGDPDELAASALALGKLLAASAVPLEPEASQERLVQAADAIGVALDHFEDAGDLSGERAAREALAAVAADLGDELLAERLRSELEVAETLRTRGLDPHARSKGE